MKKLITIASVILFCAFASHKYYHSHADLLINPKTGNAEAVVEVYWHDLEVSLTKSNNKKITTTDKSFNEYCADYFKKHFVIKDSLGAEQKQTYIGSEIKADMAIIYVEFPAVKTFRATKMTNTLLLKEFPQQVNQVNLKQGEKRKSLVFTGRNTTQTLAGGSGKND